MRMTLLLAAYFSSVLPSCALTEDDCAGLACGPVGPPVEVTVLDVPDATVTITRQDGAALTVSCGGEARTYCSAEITTGSPVGIYVVHVEAPGYVPVELEVVVEATPPGGCCNPGFEPESVTVELTPA